MSDEWIVCDDASISLEWQIEVIFMKQKAREECIGVAATKTNR